MGVTAQQQPLQILKGLLEVAKNNFVGEIDW
jgi:hypothetical protein